MKIKRIFKLFLTTTISIIPISAIALNLNEGYVEIPDEIYDEIVKINELYYSKLGLKYNNTSYKKEENYNNVGIIDIGNLDIERLFIKNSKNNIVKLGNLPNNIENDNHPFSVVSTIGTDSGINKNANIFYSSLSANGKNFTNILDDFIKDNKNKKYDTKLINISIGFNNFIDTYKNNTSKNINNKKIEPDVENYDKFEDLLDIWLYYNFFTNKSFYEKWKNKILYKYEVLDKKARENNIKIIMSSGNFNNYKEVLIQKSKKVLSLLQKNSFSPQTLKEEFKKIRDILYLPGDNVKTHFDDLLFFLDNAKETDNFFKDLKNNIPITLEGLEKFQSMKNFEGIITVGSVDYNNVHTIFSSFGDIDNDNSPFVSAYGQGIFDENDYKNIFKSYKIVMDYLNKNPNIDPKIKEQIKYWINFNGTSKAAPMITGLISLLQNQIEKNLTISETKLLLAASSNYSTKNPEENNNNNNEYWKQNRTKNKTGFGIPKFFKMKDIIKSENYINSDEFKKIIKNIDKYDISIIKLNDLILNKPTKHLTSTFILTKKMSFYDWFSEKKNNSENKNFYNILYSLINNNKKIKDELFKFNNSNRSSYKVFSSLKLNKKNSEIERLKISDSNSSEHERTYFGEYKEVLNGKLETKIYLKELDLYRKLLRENELINNKNKQIDFLNKIYFEYMEENWDFASYIDVEYKND
ncbi:S8 family serine peptidase [Mycoplasma leonicaptivi]|uniref:S8 family serine peptidase n=1 Tax=Mycoplasma leonicaptivi TaxID=36742 RepID=UPI0004883B04|nr:S8 family serine peptidase [Mycoplasma leonicaptivi]